MVCLAVWGLVVEVKKKSKVKKVVAKYLKSQRTENPNTYRARCSDMNHFLTWCEANNAKRLKDIGPGIVRGFVRDRSEVEKPLSVSRRLAIVKHFLKSTFDQLGLPSPGKDVSFKAEYPIKTKVLSVADVQLLSHAAAQGPKNSFLKARNSLVIQFYANTGLRRSEIVRIQRSQLRLPEKVITDVSVKGEKYRTVRFNQRLLFALEQYLELREQWLSQFGYYASLPPEKQARFPLLLSGREGSTNPRTWRVSEMKCYRIVKHAAEALGQKITPHDLRHYFAHQVYEFSGKDVRVTQKALGHSSVMVTEKYLGIEEREVAEHLEF